MPIIVALTVGDVEVETGGVHLGAVVGVLGEERIVGDGGGGPGLVGPLQVEVDEFLAEHVAAGGERGGDRRVPLALGVDGGDGPVVWRGAAGFGYLEKVELAAVFGGTVVLAGAAVGHVVQDDASIVRPL